MQIKPLNVRVRKQIAQLSVGSKFEKQKRLFEINPFYPSLHTEKLEPKSVGLYSFRIDQKYRAIFRIHGGTAEIVHVTKHYEK